MPFRLFHHLLLSIALLLGAGQTAQAGRADCSGELQAGAPPVLINQALAAKTHQLCYSQFVLFHSGVTRTPLWSAEHLTARRVRAAQRVTRRNSFHAEQRLPQAERSKLRDYQGSGFDRGHMAPGGDMGSQVAQRESFSLANMIPQAKCQNERLWEGIESALRDLTLQERELYVVTGPGFVGERIQTINDRVSVPTNVFKAIYVPSRNTAGAYWSPNDNSLQWESVSIARLKELIGIDVFPHLEAAVKQTAMTLPEPTPHFSCNAP